MKTDKSTMAFGTIPEPTKMPEKALHGVLVMRLSRYNDFRFGGCSGEVVAHPDHEIRGRMYAEAFVKTSGFQGRVEVTLTPTEVKTFNAIEARIAERLSKEIVTKGI